MTLVEGLGIPSLDISIEKPKNLWYKHFNWNIFGLNHPFVSLRLPCSQFMQGHPEHWWKRSSWKSLILSFNWMTYTPTNNRPRPLSMWGPSWNQAEQLPSPKLLLPSQRVGLTMETLDQRRTKLSQLRARRSKRRLNRGHACLSNSSMKDKVAV